MGSPAGPEQHVTLPPYLWVMVIGLQQGRDLLVLHPVWALS